MPLPPDVALDPVEQAIESARRHGVDVSTREMRALLWCVAVGTITATTATEMIKDGYR